MGGKVWSKKEEEHFWLELVPHSPKRLGKDRKNEEKSWDWVGSKMKEYMGDEARRDYTQLCVFEHYFQNTYLARFSPNAGTLPLKYYKHEQALKKRKEVEAPQKEEEKESKPKAPKGRAAKKSAAGQAENPIEVDAGDKDTPIVIECQYPTNPSYPGHAPPIPRLAVPSAPAPNFAPPGYMPPSPYYFHQFLANHDRMVNRDTEEESLFVIQSPASWMDGMVPHRGYYYHR
ncbi:hypothetical protein N657DRAFT_678032 [Parathielavia appendiculata]|uniref:Uncharacterized protein n=1 Tax=Parathielavia appendiculata TaxID=2587402 RepID=A0AAN6U767_9PEZI|nr:hypothetical protein N657DRAFT_678032 [Parathielavia appendiculata]